MDRCVIKHVDIQIAVIETIAAAQGKVHGHQAVMAGESDASRNCWILVSILLPLDKDIT